MESTEIVKETFELIRERIVELAKDNSPNDCAELLLKIALDLNGNLLNMAANAVKEGKQDEFFTSCVFKQAHELVVGRMFYLEGDK